MASRIPVAGPQDLSPQNAATVILRGFFAEQVSVDCGGSGFFGQRDKLKADRSKRGVRGERKEKAAQRSVQGASGDGGAFRGEDPGGAGGGIWGSSDDDQQLEAGADEACGRAVWARQQGGGGRGCRE